jgi:hypothetical protein
LNVSAKKRVDSHHSFSLPWHRKEAKGSEKADGKNVTRPTSDGERADCLRKVPAFELLQTQMALGESGLNFAVFFCCIL